MGRSRQLCFPRLCFPRLAGVVAVVVGIVAVLCGVSVARPAPAKAEGGPEKVIVGAFVNAVQDVSMATNSYIADVYVWLRWQNPKFDPTGSVTVVNTYGGDTATLHPLYEHPMDMPDGYKLMLYRTQGSLATSMDLRRYPFDVQNLTISLEDNAYDSSELEYVPDVENTPITANPAISIPGYTLGTPTLAVDTFEYPTTFGSTASTTAAKYSRVTMTLPLRRNVIPLLLKLMLPILVVVLLTSLIFALPARLEDSRIAIAITAMLTLMALQWSVTGELPDVGYLMLIDAVFLVSMVYILAVTAYSVFSSRNSLHEHGEAAATRLDRRMGLLSLALYAGLLWLTGLIFLH